MIVPVTITGDTLNFVQPAITQVFPPDLSNPFGTTGGDLFPSQTRPYFIKDLSIPSKLDPLPPLWNDVDLNWGHNLDQYVLREIAANRFGDVPDGKEYFVRIFQMYRLNLVFDTFLHCIPNPVNKHMEKTYEGWTTFTPSRFCSIPPGGCGLCLNCPDDQATLSEDWATDLPFIGTGIQGVQYVCGEGFWIIEKWREPGEPEEHLPEMIEPPPTINLPVEFPAPPTIPRAQAPVLHGGVIENVSVDDAYIHTDINPDGSYDVNMGIPLTCVDCGAVEQTFLIGTVESGPEPEVHLTEGPANTWTFDFVLESGGGGTVDLVEKEFSRPWMNPATGQYELRAVTMHVPGDNTSDMGSTFNEIFYMLQQIINRDPAPVLLAPLDAGTGYQLDNP